MQVEASVASEVVVKCDICGKAHETVRTYTIKWDGQIWDVDLDEEHAEPILDIARKGRQQPGPSRVRDPHKALEQRIRNAPAPAEKD